MPKVDFRQFQECEAQNDDSMAMPNTQRRYAEVGMVVAYHLGGLSGTSFDCSFNLGKGIEEFGERRPERRNSR